MEQKDKNSEKNSIEKDLGRLQGTLLGMLGEIDRICEKYAISYVLFAGTALGAVRHGGFIPWDDDLDLLMLRADYERFLEVAPGELSGDYFLQKEFSEHWPMFFSKLRKNGTALMEKTVPKDPAQHQGIYVDIFPCDNLSDHALYRKLQFVSSKIVIAKSLHRRGYLTDSRRKKLFMGLCRLLPMRPFRRIAVNRKGTGTQMVHSFFGASSRFDKSVYAREWIAQTVRMPFCGGEYPVSEAYDRLLTTLYGDYMVLPPEGQRKCKEHAMLIDFEHSYERYIDWQKQQKIDTYTRSIR